MIDRDKLPYIKNILSLHNDHVDLTMAYNIITSLKDKNTYHFLKQVSDNLNSLYEFKTIGLNLLEGEKEGNLYQFYTNLLKITNRELDIDYLSNVLLAGRRFKDREADILDSFSPNQLASKTELLNAVDNVVPLETTDEITIFGSWYGSVLVPKLQNKVARINCIDLDKKSLRIAKNTLFQNLENIEYIEGDVFKKDLKRYQYTKLFINTSCEHMPAMKEWPYWNGLNHEFYFAFQSNNMFGIEGHINCVNNIEEFEDQLPERAEVLYKEEIEDTRGTRYMLVGKFKPI